MSTEYSPAASPTRRSSRSMSVRILWLIRVAATPSIYMPVRNASCLRSEISPPKVLDPRRIEYGGNETDGLSVDYKSRYTA